MSWQSILRSIIAGTARSPLPEGELALLGLRPAADPAQTALESLAAAHLLQKAAFPLAAATESTPPADADTRACCGDATVQDLSSILSGRYAEVLPEFLALLSKKNLQLPPGILPDLLDKAARDASLAEMIRPVLGSRGAWLARQHPRWKLLAGDPETDWFTATFAERKQLLRQTRARNPLLALAWLEKTWLEEKAEHKVQFIDMLSIRLSPADEDLLERAFADKSREVRLAALQLLVLLPGSRVGEAVKRFFQEKFNGAAGLPARETFLKRSLPDLSEEALQPWLTLLPTAAKSDWRNELFRLFVRLLPPGNLLIISKLTHEQALQCLDDAKDAAALLEALVRHRDGSWTTAVLQHFSCDFRHAVWHHKTMTAFLTLFAVETMDFLHRNRIFLENDNEQLLRALEQYRRPWPKSLLDRLLEQYRRSAFSNESEIPGWHYASALHVAAYHCLPSEAMNNSVVRDYLQYPQPARPREFELFLDIVRFRLRMQEH